MAGLWKSTGVGRSDFSQSHEKKAVPGMGTALLMKTKPTKGDDATADRVR